MSVPQLETERTNTLYLHLSWKLVLEYICGCYFWLYPKFGHTGLSGQSIYIIAEISIPSQQQQQQQQQLKFS